VIDASGLRTGNEPEQWMHNIGTNLTPALHAMDGGLLRRAVARAGYNSRPAVLGPATAVAECSSWLGGYNRCMKPAKRGVPADGDNYMTCMCGFQYLEEFLRGSNATDPPVDAITFHAYPLSPPGRHVTANDLHQDISLLNNTRAAIAGVRAAVDKTLGRQFPVQCLEGAPGLQDAGGSACHIGLGPDGRFHVPSRTCGTNITFVMANFDMAGSLAAGGAERYARQALNGILGFGCENTSDSYVNPGYWVSILWNQVMGTEVRLVDTAGAPRTLRAYAHSNASSMGVLLLNFDRDAEISVQLWLPPEQGTCLSQRSYSVVAGPDQRWRHNADVHSTPGILINGRAPSFTDGVAAVRPFEAPSRACDGRVTVGAESLAFVSFKSEVWQGGQ